MTPKRKSLIGGVVFLIVTAVLVGTAIVALTTSEPKPKWLVVMNAEAGQFEKSGKAYTLTLNGLDEAVLAFTDRPERQAQTWDTAAFLTYWANEFDDDPPNAVVNANGVQVAVTLSDPRVGKSASTDRTTAPDESSVTFTATPLRGQNITTNPMEQPTVFVDNFQQIQSPGNKPIYIPRPMFSGEPSNMAN